MWQANCSWKGMRSKEAIVAAVALADCLETYTSDNARPENILLLAETLQHGDDRRRRNRAVAGPQELGNWIESLPAHVLHLLVTQKPGRA